MFLHNSGNFTPITFYETAFISCNHFKGTVISQVCLKWYKCFIFLLELTVSIAQTILSGKVSNTFYADTMCKLKKDIYQCNASSHSFAKETI